MHSLLQFVDEFSLSGSVATFVLSLACSACLSILRQWKGSLASWSMCADGQDVLKGKNTMRMFLSFIFLPFPTSDVGEIFSLLQFRPPPDLPPTQS